MNVQVSIFDALNAQVFVKTYHLKSLKNVMKKFNSIFLKRLRDREIIK